jgi:HEAT repeat protein
MQYEDSEWKTKFDNVIRTVTRSDPPSSRSLILSFGAVHAFEALGTNAAPAVPFLIQSLKNGRPNEAFPAAVMLGVLKLEPGLAVPALTNSVRHPIWMVRLSAVHSLGDFGTNARPALPVLLNMLNDQELYEAVTNAIQRIDPETLKRATQK